MANWGDYHPVSGAGWSAYWRISQADGGGLEVWFADFQGKRVMWRGTQPFALVPYHTFSPTFKDGLDPHCGGVGFTALKHGAPNAWNDASQNAGADTEAVVVKVEPQDDFHPAELIIAAKFQCGWYQYVHRWVFTGDGVIHPQVAMGGHLMPDPSSPTNSSDRPHIHHMYFRVDLDIDGQFPHDVFEVFNHNNFNHPGGDQWDIVKKQSKLLANPDSARKWRVRNTVSKNETGQFRGYEIELPQLAARDKFSTGDVWVTVYRGDGVQQGEGVGLTCTDKEMESVYAVGPLDIVNGSDIVFWAVVRAHHEPRNQGEEAIHLPYHYEEFSITPHNFARFREDGGGHGGRGGHGG